MKPDPCTHTRHASPCEGREREHRCSGGFGGWVLGVSGLGVKGEVCQMSCNQLLRTTATSQRERNRRQMWGPSASGRVACLSCWDPQQDRRSRHAPKTHHTHHDLLPQLRQLARGHMRALGVSAWLLAAGSGSASRRGSCGQVRQVRQQRQQRWALLRAHAAYAAEQGAPGKTGARGEAGAGRRRFQASHVLENEASCENEASRTCSRK